MATTYTPGGSLDKLVAGNYDPQFEKFWRSASWKAHLKAVVYYVWCCLRLALDAATLRVTALEEQVTVLEGQVAALELQAIDFESRIAALEGP